MKPRRALLAAVALALAVFDGWWSYEHFFAPNAKITFVGLDSFAMVMPKAMQGARLASGKWDRDPTSILKLDFARGRDPRRVALVSLAPEPTLGKAVAVIRDLKNRKICSLLITDSGSFHNFKDLPDNKIEVSSLLLCGEPVGDAVWIGTLPPDRSIRVPPQVL